MTDCRTIWTVACLCFVAGCTGLLYRDPAFVEPEKAVVITDGGAAQSGLLAYENLTKDGWDSLYDLSNPRFNDYSLIGAQDFFNLAWERNQSGYDSYWGWGVIRMEQANRAYCSWNVERYLKEGVSYMVLAGNNDTFPEEHRNALNLDLARGYCLLGQYYLRCRKACNARKCINSAIDLLRSINPKGKFEEERKVEITAQLQNAEKLLVN